jgi:hypothetical protein
MSVVYPNIVVAILVSWEKAIADVWHGAFAAKASAAQPPPALPVIR